MIEHHVSSGPVPKLALTRVEAAQALGISPATIDRLTLRGLLRPSRATYRPLYAVKELERFLKDTSKPSEWVLQAPQFGTSEPSSEFTPAHKARSRQEVPS